MRADVNKVIYVMETGAQLMDKIRRECSCWADGNENICLTFDEAETLPELAEVLKGVAIANCDVIVSR
jgi:hypothetical protein